MYTEFDTDERKVFCSSDKIDEEAIDDLELILQIMKSSKHAILLGERKSFTQEQVEMAIEIVKTIAEYDEAIIQLQDEVICLKKE